MALCEAGSAYIPRRGTDLKTEPIDAVDIEQGLEVLQRDIAQDSVRMVRIAAPHQADGEAARTSAQGHGMPRLEIGAAPGCDRVVQPKPVRQAQQRRLRIDLRHGIGRARDTRYARNRLCEVLERILHEQPNLVPALGEQRNIAHELKRIAQTLIVPQQDTTRLGAVGHPIPHRKGRSGTFRPTQSPFIFTPGFRPASGSQQKMRQIPMRSDIPRLQGDCGAQARFSLVQISGYGPGHRQIDPSVGEFRVGGKRATVQRLRGVGVALSHLQVGEIVERLAMIRAD